MVDDIDQERILHPEINANLFVYNLKTYRLPGARIYHKYVETINLI